MKPVLYFPFLVLEKFYINVALSCLALLAYFARLVNTSLGMNVYLMLAGTILVIYNFDYLFDEFNERSKKGYQEKVSQKVFPGKVFTGLGYEGTIRISIILACSLTNLVLIYFYYEKYSRVIYDGILLSAIVIAYFLVLKLYRNFFLIKEFVVAAVFTLMISLLISNLTWSLFFSCLLLLVHNALIFSLGNHNKDKSSKSNSIVLYFGYEKIFKATDAIGFLGVIFILFNQASFPEPWLAFYLILCFLAQGILSKNLKRIENYEADKKNKHEPRLLYLIGNSIFALVYLLFYVVAASSSLNF